MDSRDNETAMSSGMSVIDHGFAVALLRCPNRKDRYFVLDCLSGSKLPVNYWGLTELARSDVLKISFDRMVAGLFTEEEQFDQHIEQALEDGFREVSSEEFDSFCKKWREFKVG